MANHNTACFDLAIWFKKNSRAIKNTRKRHWGIPKSSSNVQKRNTECPIGLFGRCKFCVPKIIGPVSSEREKLATIADSLGINIRIVRLKSN